MWTNWNGRRLHARISDDKIYMLAGTFCTPIYVNREGIRKSREKCVFFSPELKWILSLNSTRFMYAVLLLVHYFNPYRPYSLSSLLSTLPVHLDSRYRSYMVYIRTITWLADSFLMDERGKSIKIELLKLQHNHFKNHNLHVREHHGPAAVHWI